MRIPANLAALTILFLSAMVRAAPQAGAEPAGGSPQAPYRVVMQVSEGDPALWNRALANIRNIQRELGEHRVHIEVVAIGPGLELLRDDSLAANRVQETMSPDVEFVACRNTMQAQHVAESELIAGISYVQSGYSEIIRRQAQGFAYLRP